MWFSDCNRLISNISTSARYHSVDNWKLDRTELAAHNSTQYSIIRDLHRIGLRGRLPVFVSEYLRDRRIRVRIGTTLSDEFYPEEGVPTGDVLAVTCFGLKINELPSCIAKDIFKALFVDDPAVCFRGRYLDTIERHLQQAGNAIHEWATRNGFRFAAHKCKVVHFTAPRSRAQRPPHYDWKHTSAGDMTPPPPPVGLKVEEAIEGVSKCMIYGQEAQAKFNEYREAQGSHDEVHSDGSKINERVGAAAVINRHFQNGETTCRQLSKRLPDNSYIFATEATAISLALNYYQHMGPVHHDVVVYSDSMSCLQAIEAEDTENPFICHLPDHEPALVIEWQGHMRSFLLGTKPLWHWSKWKSGPTSKRDPRPRYRPTGKCPLYRYETTGQLLHSEVGSNQVGCSCTWQRSLSCEINTGATEEVPAPNQIWRGCNHPTSHWPYQGHQIPYLVPRTADWLSPLWSNTDHWPYAAGVCIVTGMSWWILHSRLVGCSLRDNSWDLHSGIPARSGILLSDMV